MLEKLHREPTKEVSTLDLAEILGLARSTVVRALRRDPKIKAETIERVHVVARQLGYKHNHIARSLASGRTNIVGCVVPNVANPFYADMITEITTYLADNKLSVLLGVTNDSDTMERNYLETFMAYRVEGILLAAPPTDYIRDYYYDLKSYERPVVMIGEGESLGIDSVRADDSSGAYDLVCFLKRQGYTRIAFIGDLEAEGGHTWAGRLDGYNRGLLENNLRYDPRYLVNCKQITGLPECVEQLLSLEMPPDVIFAGNDRYGIELIHVLQKRGLRVPQDMAVVGFDNISVSAEMNPRLTTVDLHIVHIVRKAVDRLLYRVNAFHAHGDVEDVGKFHVRIKPELCIRDTTRVLQVAQR